MDKIKLVRTVITSVLGVMAVAALTLVVILVYKAGRPAGMNGEFSPSFSNYFNGEVPEVYPPLGIMIENHSLSRPYQKGLSRAAVVYESPTEANITRFLAIFPADTLNAASGASGGASGGGAGGADAGVAGASGVFYPEKFGPVRSARVYFLDWMHEYNGVYAHVGGRFDALARLQKENIINVDQFFYDAQFKRENVGLTALEHTMFTTGKALQKLIEEKNWIWDRVSHPLLERDGKTIKFSVDSADAPNGVADGAGSADGVADGVAEKITINFGHSSYEVDYEYDAEIGRYKRYQHGAPHMDRQNAEQIAPEIIVAQRVNAWSNNDSAGSISIKTIGSGDAIIFAGGHRVEATWEKKSPEEPTRFFYKDNGGEISFGTNDATKNAGPIWVEIVPLYNSVMYR